MAFPHFRDYGDQAQYTFSTSDSYSTTRRSSLENPNRPVGSLSRGHSTLSHHHLRHTPVSNYFPPTSRRGSASGAANNHRESTNNYRAHASGGDGAGGGPSGRVQGGGRLDPPVDQDFMSETNTISRHGSIIPQLLETPPEFGHLKSRPIVQEDYSTSSLNVEYENHQDGNGGGHGGHRARFNAQNLRDLEAQVDKPIRPSLREIGGRLHGSSAADKGRGKSYSKEEIREEKRTTVSAEELDAGSIKDSTWLAAVISSDTKLAIFKSFEVLLAECLLYLQDRLSELEENIWVLNETESNMKGMDDAYFSIERQEIMLEVADLSKKYYKTLRTYQRILHSRPPHRRDLKAFNHYRRIAHSKAKRYESEDVIAIIPRPDDVFEKVIAHDSPVMRIGRSIQRGVRYFKENVLRIKRSTKKIEKPRDWTSTNSRSAKFARFFISFLAPLMTLIPIVALYYLPGNTNRLIALICFTMAFSALLGASDASNSEVLAGSTGYAAVLVVFVGTGAFTSE